MFGTNPASDAGGDISAGGGTGGTGGMGGMGGGRRREDGACARRCDDELECYIAEGVGGATGGRLGEQWRWRMCKSCERVMRC